MVGGVYLRFPILFSLFALLHLEATITDALAVGGEEHHHKFRCHESDKISLLKFKESLSDPSNRLLSWVHEQDCCQWKGVACSNVTGHVTMLDLRNLDSSGQRGMLDKPLKGKVLNPCLRDLSNLSYLDLSGNNFNFSSIPTFLGSFTKLRYLDLSNAMFRGTIPYQIGNLSNLRYLGLNSDFNSLLFGNNLDWLSNLSSLKYLDMGGIRNITSWVDNINHLSSLKELYLSICQIGKISSFLNFTSLEVLDLSYNDLGCQDLKLLQNLTSLLHLEMQSNHLNCSIPGVFSPMVSLSRLDLSENKLVGPFPNVLGGLTSLTHLDLSENKLVGPFPNVLGGLTVLTHLDLSFNNFSGHFPDILGGRMSLAYLDLSSNKFTGHLPDVSCTKKSLAYLDLSRNNFTGYFSESINQLSELLVLDVSSNSLDGVISESHLSNLSKLQKLDISFNLFHCNFSVDWIPPLQLNDIRMSSCSMGPLFPAWVQSWKNVSYLDISNNGIQGSIPSWYWKISAYMAYMNLSGNHISGKLPFLPSVSAIPTWSSALGILIDLSSNQLEGLIPQISPNITSLNLSKNRFSGSLSRFLCNAKSVRNSLAFLDLSKNLLSGGVPDCWMYWPSILVLNLANNNFSEEIPRSMGHLQKMFMLVLRNNTFKGELSFVLKNLTRLQLIDVANNRLSGNVSEWIGELQELQVLMLHSNKLDGYIPAQLCHLPNLQILDLARNSLQGKIPYCIGNLSSMTNRERDDHVFVGVGNYAYSQHYDARVTLVWKGREYEFRQILPYVKMIDLSSNQLRGVIPEEVTNLLELVALNLSGNRLTGTIPNKIGSLQKLEFLDLSRNQLLGDIPMALSNLTLLSVLDLSYNNLSGIIPLSTQLQSLDASSFTGNPKLCGPPLLVKCESETPYQGPPLTVDEDEADVQMWFYIGLGLGYSVGISGVCLFLVLNRSWRIVYFRFVEQVADWVYVVTVVNKRKLQRPFRSL